MADKKFYLTTPIFYPNAKLHMGHAYTATLGDIIVRYHRLIKDKTYFLTGSDENTQKMVDSARKEGKEPMAFLDDIVGKFSTLFKELDISYDQFIRTTDQKRHWLGATALWNKLVSAGDIYKREYEGLYCVGHEAFITEKDLVDGKCPDHGTMPEFLKEENYFFRLSKYTVEIRRKIESDKLRIIPETRKNEILSLLGGGLEDVSFSRPRKADWPPGLGVPVPGDASQVMYVWCDALSNYITALGFGTDDDALYKEFWPADMHVIGKDILRFHAAIWPGMLLSAGLPLPKTLLVHGFITSEGKKMSKSLGNVIDPEELLAEYGTDAVRYYLARHISSFEDGDITRESFKELYNANLANGLGNVVARIMQLAETNLPQAVAVTRSPFPKEFAKKLDTFEINKAFDYVFERIGALDQTITHTEPFKVIKTDPEHGRELIASLVQELATIDLMLEPLLPETSKKIIGAIIANKKPENLFPRKD
ncbi:MAG: methionine--tRNA ligase [Minisyncoccia bacterium]|jgi:methionyl-tRNA synthetase